MMHYFKQFKGEARWLRLLLITLAVFTLSSCRLQIGYSFFDNWLGWQINRYLPLNDEQKKQLKKDIKNWHQWHREHELPQYAEFFLTLDQLVKQPEMSTETLQQTLNEGLGLWHQAIEPMIPKAASLLSELSPEQTKKFITKLDKDDQEFRDKYLNMPLEKQKKERQKTFEKRMKSWMGSPTDAQYERVKAWADALHYDPALQSQQQTAWREHLQESLTEVNQFNDEALFFRTTTKLFVHYDMLWSEQFREMVAHNQKVTLQMMVDLHKSLTPKQKARIHKKFLGYREDILSLISKAKK